MIVITNGIEYIYTDSNNEIQRTTDINGAKKFTFGGCSAFLNKNIKSTKDSMVMIQKRIESAIRRKRESSFHQAPEY